MTFYTNSTTNNAPNWNSATSMTSIPPTNLSSYQLLIFWTWILPLMEIQITTNVLDEAYYPS